MASRENFLAECLVRTNEHRIRHGVEGLRLNSEISRVAQAWADKIASRSVMQHNPSAIYRGEKLGENIAYSFDSARNPSGCGMIDQWYNEVRHYNFNRPTFSSGTGHFTQLVWRTSREVGFGLAVRNGHHYLVANYSPPGNYQGEFESNVFAAGSNIDANKKTGAVAAAYKEPSFDSKNHFGRSNNSLFGKLFSGNKSEFSPMSNQTFGGFNRPSNLHNTSMSSSKGSSVETRTTVETRVEGGMKVTTTTTTRKTPQGTSTETKVHKQSL